MHKEWSISPGNMPLWCLCGATVGRQSEPTLSPITSVKWWHMRAPQYTLHITSGTGISWVYSWNTGHTVGILWGHCGNMHNDTNPNVTENECNVSASDYNFISKWGATSIVSRWFGYKRSDLQKSIKHYKKCKKTVTTKGGFITTCFYHLKQNILASTTCMEWEHSFIWEGRYEDK